MILKFRETKTTSYKNRKRPVNFKEWHSTILSNKYIDHNTNTFVDMESLWNSYIVIILFFHSFTKKK